MKLQRLLSLTRQAVDDYRLIQSGDKIAIGISGGKDSLTLLYGHFYMLYRGFAGFTRNHLNFVLLQLIWAFRHFLRRFRTGCRRRFHRMRLHLI